MDETALPSPAVSFGVKAISDDFDAWPIPVIAVKTSRAMETTSEDDAVTAPPPTTISETSSGGYQSSEPITSNVLSGVSAVILRKFYRCRFYLS